MEKGTDVADAKAMSKIRDVLNEKQVMYVVGKALEGQRVEPRSWQLVGCEATPAAEGLVGFLGDHMKVALYLRNDQGDDKCLRLFIKSMPRYNKPKSEFIDKMNYFRREMVLFKVFEEIGGDEGPNPWRPKAYICNEKILVMPDMTAVGYVTHNKSLTLDLGHVLLVAGAAARFHAAYTNCESAKCIQTPNYTLQQQHGHVFGEPSFLDSPWLRAGTKLTVNLLKRFSTKFQDIDEGELLKLYIEVCDDLKEYKDTLNIVVHKDLWSNNIMFRYENNEPTNALILDYQCARYGPPAFDVMILLYLTTSRRFREEHEKEVLEYYYKVFEEGLDQNSRARLQRYNYTFEEFLRWCEVARMYGLLVAAMIFPYILMDDNEAKSIFDDPATYHLYNLEDRTVPVLAYAHRDRRYLQRMLEVSEEMVERFLLRREICTDV